MNSVASEIEASVIIAFYNRPDILELTLAGLRRQTNRNFEIIVADDGSGKQVSEYVRSRSR